MRPRVYLAGPEVFLPDAAACAARKKAVCAAHGLEGVSPLDALATSPPGWDALPAWRRIHLCNEAHIRDAAALIANLTPFRGPSADAGTVWELGFARGLGLPIFGYTVATEAFTERTRRSLGCAGPATRDEEGMLLEDFGLADNLMIDGAIAAAGGVLLAGPPPAAGRWQDLAVFARCVAACARRLGVAG